MPRHCNSEVKEIILRVKDYFEQEKLHGKENINVNQVVQRTSECLRISESTVKRVVAEKRNTGTVNSSKPRSGRRKIEMDEFLQGVIRRNILNFYLEKRFPTITELHHKLEDEAGDIPEFSNSTLLRWVKKLQFSYKKLNNKPILMEQDSIAAKRADFLYAIKRYRDSGWTIYYTDETWCGANHSRKFGWVERVNPERRDNFDLYRGGIQEVNGYRGGIKRPSGSGQRVIILHIGNANGFLDGALKCFVGKKGSSDYHNEMNKEHFEEWYRFVLSVIPDKSVIVIDQAPYHTMLDPNFRNPTSAWTRSRILEWMATRQVILPEGIQHFSQLNKPQLLELSRAYHYEKKYLLEKITTELRGDDVKLLWLPVAHCEFNAIELIWAYVKNNVAKHNTTFKINDVMQLCIETMQNIPATVWANCVQHANKIEDMYRSKDHLVDVEIEPLIIKLHEDDTDSDEYDSDESEDDAGDLDNDL